MGCNQSKDVSLVAATSANANANDTTVNNSTANAVKSAKDAARFDHERPDNNNKDDNESTDREESQPPISESYNYDEEPPSFVLSGNSDIIKSSDSEAVHGMVSSFTFSFIQVSESNDSIFTPSDISADDVQSDFTDDEDTQSERDSEVTVEDNQAAVELPPIPEDESERASLSQAESEGDDDEEVHKDTEEPQIDDTIDEKPQQENPVVKAVKQLITHINDATDAEIEVEAEIAAVEEEATEEAAVAEDAAAVDETVEVAVEAEAEVETVEVETDAEVEIVEAEVTTVVVADTVKTFGSEISETVLGESSVDGISSVGAGSDSNPAIVVVPTIYTLAGTSFEKGVTQYHIQMTDGRNLQWAAPVCKRFTEFCQMYTKLQASSLPHSKTLPVLPPKGGMITFLRGRQNKKVVDDRVRKFTAILEYISLHRELANSSVFQSFVNQ